MLDLLPEKLPGWKDRTEADLGMAILELFAYVGDQFSYVQDRVANEAFLRSATQYESVRQLLRLIDYTPDPGAAARVILRFEAKVDHLLPSGFRVATSTGKVGPAVLFETTEPRLLFQTLNTITLAADAPSNPAGTEAALAGTFGPDVLPPGSWIYFRSGDSGEWAQVRDLQVNPGPPETTIQLQQPLQGNYASAASEVFGNGVPASHGESQGQTARGSGGEPGQSLALDFAPLTFLEDEAAAAPVSTLRVDVGGQAWSEVEDFISSGAADFHFRTQRSNDGFVSIHFGDGAAGLAPPEGALIETNYRTGLGETGLVAKDTLRWVLDAQQRWALESGEIAAITNPQASFGGRDPESLEQAKLAGPRQIAKPNRAVVPADYEAVLLEGVPVGEALVRPLHAKAYFSWTGSWTTVFVSVEMPDREPMTPRVRGGFCSRPRAEEIGRLRRAHRAPALRSALPQLGYRGQPGNVRAAYPRAG